MALRIRLWPLMIVITFVAFAASMIGFAIVAGNNRDSLTVKDYYKAELQYQDIINRKNNYQQLPEKVQCSYDKASGIISVKWPEMFRKMETEGSVKLYRPSNQEKDIEWPAEPSTAQQQLKPGHELRGKYELKVEWTANGVGYYHEQDLFVE